MRTTLTGGLVGFFLGLSVATASAADGADAPPVIGPNASSFVLDNGLQVVVIPDHRAPVVTHMVWYKVGAADEPDGKSGIAHFLEHLMFKGTTNHPEGEFSTVVGEIGGDENAFTTADYTAYFQRVARTDLELMMSYEADRMANLVLTDEVIVPERKVVLEERSMRLDRNPSARLGVAADASLYLRSPYGVPVIGWREDIEKLDRTDAIAFYDRWYTPNNAILVVAGDIEADEVREMASRTYGKLARRAEPPPRERLAAHAVDAPRVVTVTDPKVTVESASISWLAPSYRTAAPGEAEALDVLMETIAGGATSPVYRDLVVDQKIATSAGVGYRSDTWDAASISAWIVPKDGVSLETAREALLAAIDKAIDGIDEEQVARAKRRLEAGTIYAQDSQSRLARIFGASLATGETLEDVQTWPARIRKVTVDDVRAAAAGRFDPDRSVTGYLRASPAEERS